MEREGQRDGDRERESKLERLRQTELAHVQTGPDPITNCYHKLLRNVLFAQHHAHASAAAVKKGGLVADGAPSATLCRWDQVPKTKNGHHNQQNQQASLTPTSFLYGDKACQRAGPPELQCSQNCNLMLCHCGRIKLVEPFPQELHQTPKPLLGGTNMLEGQC